MKKIVIIFALFAFTLMIGLFLYRPIDVNATSQSSSFDVVKIETSMIEANDELFDVTKLEGFKAITFEEVSTWMPPAEDEATNLLVIFNVDYDMCVIDKGGNHGQASLSKTTTNNEMIANINAYAPYGYAFYYTSKTQFEPNGLESDWTPVTNPAQINTSDYYMLRVYYNDSYQYISGIFMPVNGTAVITDTFENARMFKFVQGENGYKIQGLFDIYRYDSELDEYVWEETKHYVEYDDEGNFWVGDSEEDASEFVGFTYGGKVTLKKYDLSDKSFLSALGIKFGSNAGKTYIIGLDDDLFDIYEASLLPVELITIPEPHIHDEIEFTPVYDFSDLSSNGHYYLANDIMVTKDDYITISSGETLDLCLNGFGIKKADNSSTREFIRVEENGTFNLYDCSDKVHKYNIGDVHSYDDKTVLAGIVDDSLTENYYTFTGGYIAGQQRYAVYVQSDGIFNMYGGNFVGCAGDSAVYVRRGTFNMFGGAMIANNSDANSGPALCIANGGAANISSGSFIRNTTRNLGGAIFVGANSSLVMTGGDISYNVSGSSMGEGSGGAINCMGNIDLTNVTITHNYSYSFAGGIYLDNLGDNNDAVANFKNVTFSDNEAIYDGGALRAVFSAEGECNFEGCTFTNNITPGKGGAISLETTEGADTTIKFKNCTISGNVSNGDPAQYDNGLGGAISAVINYQGGPGAIVLDGTTINNNTATVKGGAIYVQGGSASNPLVIEFKGGTSITGNSAPLGGGIYADTFAYFNFSGLTTIKDNLGENDIADDIHYSNVISTIPEEYREQALASGFYVGAVNVTSEDALGSLIGIRLESLEFTSDFSIDMSLEDANKYKDLFFSDDDAYFVGVNATNNQLMLTDHQHNWSYVASGATITASCSNPNCPVTSGFDLTLESPEGLTYSGSAKVAGLTEGYSTDAFPNASTSIKYFQDNAEVTTGCINVGTYLAKITFGNAVAMIEFEITKATPTPAALEDQNAVYGQLLSEIDLPDGWAWNSSSDKVGNAGTNVHKATFTPEDTDNYNTVEQNVNVIVAKADPTYVVPNGLTALVNKTLADVNLPQGFAWVDNTQNVGSEVAEKVFKATFTPEDTDNYNIVENIDITVLVVEHEHSWSYVASGATITATCNGEECPITEGLVLEMVAPEDLVYNGYPKKIGFVNGLNAEAYLNYVLKYYIGDNEVECQNAGLYVAKVSIGGVTAELEFEITKATPTPDAIDDQNAIYGQLLSEIDLPQGWAWNSSSDKVGNAGTNVHKATFTPEDTDNYNTVEQNVNVIVAKADPEYTIPNGLTALVNKTLADVNLPQGFAWVDNTQNVGSEVAEKVFKATFTPEDTANYNIVENIDITVLVTEHEHSWSYVASGATITATCSTSECPVSTGLTLTLKAPAGDMTFDDKAKVATLEEGYSADAFANAQIKYFKDNTEVNECVNVGKYIAKVTFGNAVAMVEFEILPKIMVDPDTEGVSFEVDDAAVADNIELRVEVRTDVAEKDIAEDYAKIQEMLEANEEISKVYDVKLIQIVGGIETVIQPSDIKQGLKILVRMAIPEGINMANVRILHIHSVDDMEFVTNYNIDGNDLVFEIDRLSQFAFVTKVDVSAPNKLNGGIIALIVVGSVVALLGICFLLLFFVFAKFIIVDEKVVRAIKLGKDDDQIKLLTFKFKKEMRPEEEVFNKKKDAEEFLSSGE